MSHLGFRHEPSVHLGLLHGRYAPTLAGQARPAPTRVDFPLQAGFELTLTHELHPDWAEYAIRTKQGWAGILDGLAETLS